MGWQDLGHDAGLEHVRSVGVLIDTLGSVIVSDGDLVLQGGPSSLEKPNLYICPLAIGAADRGYSPFCAVAGTVIHAFYALT